MKDSNRQLDLVQSRVIDYLSYVVMNINEIKLTSRLFIPPFHNQNNCNYNNNDNDCSYDASYQTGWASRSWKKRYSKLSTNNKLPSLSLYLPPSISLFLSLHIHRPSITPFSIYIYHSSLFLSIYNSISLSLPLQLSLDLHLLSLSFSLPFHLSEIKQGYHG